MMQKRRRGNDEAAQELMRQYAQHFRPLPDAVTGGSTSAQFEICSLIDYSQRLTYSDNSGWAVRR